MGSKVRYWWESIRHKIWYFILAENTQTVLIFTELTFHKRKQVKLILYIRKCIFQMTKKSYVI